MGIEKKHKEGKGNSSEAKQEVDKERSKMLGLAGTYANNKTKNKHFEKGKIKREKEKELIKIPF